MGSESNAKTFFCHKDLLTAHSQYFKAILGGEGVTTTHELREEDPGAFAVIAEWLYHKFIMYPVANTSEDRQRLIIAWCLAEKLGIQDCQNLIMDYIHELLKGRDDIKVAVGVKSMTLINDLKLAEDNILRVFFIQRFAYEMLEMKRKHCRSNRTLKTGYVQFFKICPQLVPDIMIEWYSLSLRNDHTDPADHTDPCAYHVHTDIPASRTPRLYEQPTADVDEKTTVRTTLLRAFNARKPKLIEGGVAKFEEIKSEPAQKSAAKPLAESNDFWKWDSLRFRRTDSNSSTPTP